MNQIAALALTATFTLITQPAYADVNMLEGSFRTTFIDLEVGGLKIQRRYDSRSNLSGIFGFGWCSTFDTHLEFTRLANGKQETRINDCGRSKGAALMYKNGRYTQTLTTGLARIYDADSGQLIGLRSTRSGDPAVAILRSRNRLPRAAALGEGKKTRPWIQLEFDDLDENVTHLTTSNAKYLAYTYSKDRDLLTAKNAWNNTYRFEYDPLHNLSQANYPDGTSEQMIYDTDHDRLLTYRGRDGCEETYTYQLASEKSADHLHQISTARLICENKHKREVRYDFHFRRSDKSWLLTNMSLTHDGTTQSTSFSISNSGGAQ